MSQLLNDESAWGEGGWMKPREQIMLASAGPQVDLTVFQEVMDSSTQWKIQGLEILRPELLLLIPKPNA